MKKKIAILLVLLSGILFSSCGSDSKDAGETYTFSTASGTVTLIHLNDLHAHLLSHSEQVRKSDGSVKVGERGGLARIATKINQIRSSNPDNILVNVGDTFHGGAEAMFSNGNAIVDPVNALGIDVGTPGNWDYAYGPLVTNARFGNYSHPDVKRPNYKNLAANASYRIPPNMVGYPSPSAGIQQLFNYHAGDPFLDATTIIERGGLRIGIIGITSDIVERMHPLMAFNIEFTQGEENYLNLITKYTNDLRNVKKVNLVVVISELGIHRDYRLANILPQDSVDLFLSAHTHETTFEKLSSTSGAIVVESGDDTYLGQMDIVFEKGHPVDYQWKLHEISPSLAEDSAIKKLVEEARAPYLAASDTKPITIPVITPFSAFLSDEQITELQSYMPQIYSDTLRHSIDEVIGYTKVPLDRRQSLENNLNNAVADMMLDYAQSNIDPDIKVAITPGFRFDSSVIPSYDDYLADGQNSDLYYYQVEDNALLDGSITTADAYRFFPAPYVLAWGQTSGSNLISNVLELNLEDVFSSDVFHHSGGWTDGYSGIQLSVDLAEATGKRIQSIAYKDGTPLLESDTIKMIGCARPMDVDAPTTLCSYSGFTNVVTIENPQYSGYAFSSADFFIYGIQNGLLDSVSARRTIQDTSETAMWPQSEFYQPLEGVN